MADKFTIKKEISIPHILTFLTMLGGLVLWYSGIESRIAVAETKIVAVESNMNRVDSRLTRIEDGVNRILERMAK
jgi:hypothetical protein